MSNYSQNLSGSYIQKFSSPFTLNEPLNNQKYVPTKFSANQSPSNMALNKNPYLSPLSNFMAQNQSRQEFKTFIPDQNRVNPEPNFLSPYNTMKQQMDHPPYHHPSTLTEFPIKNSFHNNNHFLSSPNLHEMNYLQPKQHETYPQRAGAEIMGVPMINDPSSFQYKNLPPLHNYLENQTGKIVYENHPAPIVGRIMPDQPLKSSLNNFNLNESMRPPLTFIPLNEKDPSYFSSFPIRSQIRNVTNIHHNDYIPPPIFYSHKIQEQGKENKIFPDFITAFGTYKHYDLASNPSKFRKVKKDRTASKIEDQFLDNLSYLNVNFLQQSHYDKIFDALKNFIFFDRSVEKIKEDLVQRNDFDLKIIFQIFDDNNSGQIVVAEFKEGLQKLGISAEENDLYLMVNRYSKDGNRKIGY